MTLDKVLNLPKGLVSSLGKMLLLTPAESNRPRSFHGCLLRALECAGGLQIPGKQDAEAGFMEITIT